MADYIFPLNPARVAWNSKWKQKWNVASYTSAGMVRKSVVQQSTPAWTIEISFPRLRRCEVDCLLAFFAACKGSWHPFFYKDCERYKVTGKSLSVGTDYKYQAVIPFGGYEESAQKIENVKMYVGDTESTAFTVEGGKITASASGVITFDYEYLFKVVFADSISINQKFRNFYTVSLTLEVVQ